MSPIVTSLLLFIGVSLFVMTMYGRMSAILALKGDNRFDQVPARIGALLKFGFGQRRMVDREELLPGLMHCFIFGAFMVLTVRTVMLFEMGFSSAALGVLSDLTHPFWQDHAALGGLYKAYLLVKDLVAAGAV